MKIKLDYGRLEKVSGLQLSDEDREEIELLGRFLVNSERNPGPIVFPKSLGQGASQKASADYRRIEKKSKIAAQGIDDLLSALGGTNGPLGRIYAGINRLPSHLSPSDLVGFALSPEKGFSRLISDLNRARSALAVIGEYAGTAARGSMGKGEPRGPKGYRLFNTMLQALYQIYERSGGKGHGVYYDDVGGCYKGLLLDLSIDFISQLKPCLGHGPFALLPPWIAPSMKVQAPGAREAKRLGAYIMKQVIPKSH